MARSSPLPVGVYTEGGEARPAAGEEPFFSIVIPMFNREELIERALRSCLIQDFTAWEAVVVDDASTDRSAEVVEATGDPRIRLVRHERNRGACPARNSGVRAARGKWMVFLDSDDELAPGALRLMHDAALRTRGDVHRLVFSLHLEDGTITPQPPLRGGSVWEYRDYLEWAARTGEHTDFLNCVHRDVFESVSWPEGRGLEAPFHFDLARRFRTECHADVVGTLHADAPRRSGNADAPQRLRAAAAMADTAMEVLAEHGEAMRAWAPEAFATFLRSAAVQSVIAGRRGAGVRYALALLRRKPLSARSWGVLMMAFVGARGAAGVMALRGHLQRAGRSR